MMLASAATPPACLFTVVLSLVRSHVLCTQACGVAVSGSYAYVTAHLSDSLVVVDISNPASPVIRGSVASSSLMDYVRAAWSCGPGSPLGRRRMRPPRPSRSHVRGATTVDALVSSHVLCTQADGVAVSGSYAYVGGRISDSLVVVDISNPASPVIRGSVVSSSLLDGVRMQLRARGWRRAPRLCLGTIHRARVRGATSSADALSRTHSLALTCCALRRLESP